MKLTNLRNTSWLRQNVTWLDKRCNCLQQLRLMNIKSNEIKFIEQLDSMRWFSHRRSRVPEDRTRQNRMRKPPSTCTAVTPGGYTMDSSAAAYGLHRTRRLAMHCQRGWLSICLFCPRWPWPFTLKFKLGRDFCTMHLIAKFHHTTFNCSEVIVLTNKQTDAAENIHLAPLCYAGG